MLYNPQKSIREFFLKHGVIRTGHFVLTSLRHSGEYVDKDMLYPYTNATSVVCGEMALPFKDYRIQVVVAPEKGGIILSQGVANCIQDFGCGAVYAFYAEKEEELVAKFDQEFVGSVFGKQVVLGENDQVFIRRTGFVIKRSGAKDIIPGKRVLVVEDLVTTGRSVRKVVEAVQNMGGIVVGMAVIANRGNVSMAHLGNPPKFHEVVPIRIESYDPDNCPLCKDKVPINTEVGKGKEYLAEIARKK
jgi:orotate phosphoribosyltransferase